MSTEEQYLPITAIIDRLSLGINTAISYKSQLVTVDEIVAVSAVRRIEQLQAENERQRHALGLLSMAVGNPAVEGTVGWGLEEGLADFIIHRLKQRDAAIANHESWQMAWQPIESAPKYEEVLVYREDAGVMLGIYTSPDQFVPESHWDETAEALGDSFEAEDWFLFCWDGTERADGDLVPTHWMPLPPAPLMDAGQTHRDWLVQESSSPEIRWSSVDDGAVEPAVSITIVGIESIRANNFDSILGGEVSPGVWLAYKFSLEDWRARQKEVQA